MNLRDYMLHRTRENYETDEEIIYEFSADRTPCVECPLRKVCSDIDGSCTDTFKSYRDFEVSEKTGLIKTRSEEVTMTVKERLVELVKKEEKDYKEASLYAKAERVIQCGDCPIYSRCNAYDAELDCSRQFEKYADTQAEMYEEEE